MKSLRECYDEFECDKGEKHQYDSIYQQPIIDKIHALDGKQFNLLEIGIFAGASIAAHLSFIEQYTDNFKIHGVDTFQRLKPNEIPILKHPNVSYTKGDSQLAETAVSAIKDSEVVGGFHMIIDDGLHTPDGNRRTLKGFRNLLAQNPNSEKEFEHNTYGTYFVEDVWMLYDDRKHYRYLKETMSHYWLKRKREELTVAKFKQFVEYVEKISGDQYLIHDRRRKTNEPDSVIWELFP